MISINVGDICFMPMNVHNELFNGVRQLRRQHISPVVSTLSTSIRPLSSSFTKHCICPPSFSLFLSICLSVCLSFCGTPSRFPNYWWEGRWSGGSVDPQNSGRYESYSDKRQHICLTTSVTERNKYPST